MLGTKSLAKKGTIPALVLFCLFAACSSRVCAEPASVPEKSEEYKNGSELSNQGKKDKARTIYEAGAENGDAWCIYSLGVFYAEGLGGLQKDEPRALELIKKAADLNLPVACRHLADAYFEGSGLVGDAKDAKKGAEYLTIAADLNDAKACADLGMIYLRGKDSIRKDTSKGVEYLAKAADLNDGEAAGFLGHAFMFGNDVLRKDEKIGLEMIEKAAGLNDPEGLHDLGYLYTHGLNGVPKDTKKGKELTKKAVALKKPDMTVTPERLVQNYRDNAVAANLKYEDKLVRLTGHLAHIGEEDKQAFVIILADGYRQNVICIFEKGRIYEVVPLKTGTRVTVQGKVLGLQENSVILYDGWVILAN